MARLQRLGIDVQIWTMPSEIADAVPFERDRAHAHYDPGMAQRFWRALVQSDRVLKTFRSRFIGKVSPVHFFWGSFDLAVTRFSGRTAPPPGGATPNVAAWVMAEAYSHEVSSCGFWPGNGGLGEAAPAAHRRASACPGSPEWRPGPGSTSGRSAARACPPAAP
jgi:hypothetical protein